MVCLIFYFSSLHGSQSCILLYIKLDHLCILATPIRLAECLRKSNMGNALDAFSLFLMPCVIRNSTNKKIWPPDCCWRDTVNNLMQGNTECIWDWCFKQETRHLTGRIWLGNGKIRKYEGMTMTCIKISKFSQLHSEAIIWKQKTQQKEKADHKQGGHRGLSNHCTCQRILQCTLTGIWPKLETLSYPSHF